MIIKGPSRAVSAHVEAIAAVHRHPTVREVHMGPPPQLVQMAMEPQPIWVRCQLPRAVSSIPLQVSSFNNVEREKDFCFLCLVKRNL